jgi:hypothetical protein
MTDITSTPESSPQPKRAWRRFTLRALFLFVLIAGTLFGCLSHRLRELRVQDATLEHLLARGFDRITVEPAPGAAFWRVFGVDAVELSRVDLRVTIEGYHACTAEDVERLARCASVREVHLAGPGITDQSLRELAKLEALERISLEHTLVTDAGLRHLLLLPRLQSLAIGTPREGRSTANGDSIELPTFSRVTAAGIETVIARIVGLKSLWIEGPSITDATVKRITYGLPNLHTLWLTDSSITDSGLRHLASLSSLNHLGLLGSSRITDVGLKHLYECRQLKTLRLEGTQVSTIAVRELCSQVPLTFVDIVDVSRAAGSVTHELVRQQLRRDPDLQLKMEEIR